MREAPVNRSPGRSDDHITRLNPEQLAAVEHLDGPALVVAGPGTGKTSTLVGRYARLLQRGFRPEQLFTVTFTNKAADEIKERLGLASVASSGLPIGTFNSLALRIVRESCELVGLSPDFGIANEQDQHRILRGLQTNKEIDSGDALGAISRWKGRLIGAKDAMREAARGSGEARNERMLCARAYEGYEETLKQSHLIDFDDQILLAVRILTYLEARDRHSGRYAHLMVDEYQDINVAQNALLLGLLDNHCNLWVVGDDDQAIYGWRGSDPTFILEFERRFPNARRYVLTRNYRSHPDIVSASTALVSGNKKRLEKDLRPDESCPRGSELAVRVRRAVDEHREADGIASSVKTLLDHGVSPTEIAVLVRTNYLMPTITGALRHQGVPYGVTEGGDFWSMPAVQSVLGGFAQVASASVGGRWRVPPRLEEPLAATARNVRRKKFPEAALDIAYRVAEYVPYRASPERRMEWIESAMQVGREAQPFQSAAEFFAYVEQVKSVNSSRADRELVTVSTIHGAKGLEWKAVFAAGWETGLLPHRKATDMEEERRLAYVAATRAKRYLVVSYASSRHGDSASPSSFVAELVQGLPDACRRAAWPERKQPAQSQGTQTTQTLPNETIEPAPRAFPGRAKKTNTPPTAASFFAVGDVVDNSKFGAGRVVQVKKDTCVVLFWWDHKEREILRKKLRKAH